MAGNPGSPDDDPQVEPAEQPDDLPPLSEPTEDDLDDVRFFEQGGVLAVQLDGGSVSDHSIDVYDLGEFYVQIDRVQRGLMAVHAGLSLASTGRIPKPQGAATWRAGVLAKGSVLLQFFVGEPEELQMSDSGEVTSPTIRSVQELTDLLQLDAEQAVEEVSGVPDRIGKEMTGLLRVLADKELESQWRARGRERVELTWRRAGELRDYLEREVVSDPASNVVTGLLYRVDTKQSEFRLEADDGQTIRGRFAADQLEDLRRGLKRRVKLDITLIEYRYAYASEPFNRERALAEVIEIFED